MTQIRWSCVKLCGAESNQVVLNQMMQSWIKAIKLGSPEVKLGGHESNQVVLGQISWS